MKLSEDDQQYLELLKLHHPEEKCIDILHKTLKRRAITREKTLAATIEYYKRKLNRDSGSTCLAAIICPTNKKLGNVPLFKRYVAYLVSSYGASKTSEILGVSRTTLWRYYSS